jgi:hypothetical protein
MYDKQIIISVWNCRTVVSCYIKLKENEYTVEPASNWQVLEAQALEEVESQGGAFTMSGHYACSSVLADQAQFSDEAA